MRIERGDNQHLIQMLQVSRRLDYDVDEGAPLRVALDTCHYPNRQAAREYLIAAGGKDMLSGLDALVGQDIDDLRLAEGVAAQDAADAGGFENYAGSAGLVIDEQNLRGVGKNVTHFADDAVRRYDSHIRGDTVGRSAVQPHQPVLHAATRSDDLRRGGGVNVA